MKLFYFIFGISTLIMAQTPTPKITPDHVKLPHSEFMFVPPPDFIYVERDGTFKHAQKHQWIQVFEAPMPFEILKKLVLSECATMKKPFKLMESFEHQSGNVYMGRAVMSAPQLNIDQFHVLEFLWGTSTHSIRLTGFSPMNDKEAQQQYIKSFKSLIKSPK